MARLRAIWIDPVRCRLPSSVRAIRRFTVRPVLPRPCRRSATWRATCAGPGTRRPRTSSRRSTRPVGGDGARPGAAARGRQPRRGSTSSRATEFLRRLGGPSADLERYLTGDRWFQRHRPTPTARRRAPSPTSRRSSASPRCCPQYSGGLGILAGDHLKAASDLGIPIIGVGLLYRHGYFEQSLSREGWQQETYPVLDPDGCRSRCSASRRLAAPRSPSPCPTGPTCSPASGSPTSAGCRCCCSTPTSRATPTTTAT